MNSLLRQSQNHNGNHSQTINGRGVAMRDWTHEQRVAIAADVALGLRGLRPSITQTAQIFNVTPGDIATELKTRAAVEPRAAAGPRAAFLPFGAWCIISSWNGASLTDRTVEMRRLERRRRRDGVMTALIEIDRAGLDWLVNGTRSGLDPRVLRS